jgi:co-chaperonin GroES (HSP10)
MKVITTLNGHVLIRPRKTAAPAGIDIPDSVDKEKATLGEVVIGNYVKATFRDDQDFRYLDDGKIVLFRALAPLPVKHDGEECLLVNGEDIYAVIQE